MDKEIKEELLKQVNKILVQLETTNFYGSLNESMRLYNQKKVNKGYDMIYNLKKYIERI